MRTVVIVGMLLVASLLFTQFVWLAPAVPTQFSQNQFGQKVNLALRRTAHHLFIENGDSTSRIAPVQQLNATTFVIRMEHPFDYGRLPVLLHQSLAVHAIDQNYDVAVLDCTDGELQLGYNFRDVSERNEVPCGGRDQKKGCYILQLAFTAPTPARQSTPVWWAFGLLALGGAYIVWQKSSRKSIPVPQPDTVSSESQPLISVGNVSFNLANQSVHIDDSTHSLTYREAKLLHLFLRHPNQLLERDFILKSVWEDEGVTVGRSVDVFVSRLRKLLHADPTVRIVAVHGVGYRLEVSG